MEENIHDDKLDDYVRKSFEDYEEVPPTDMWDRVEEDLVPVTVQPKLRVGFQRLGWQALAAGVILVLFSTLVCEHLYYEEKLRNLSLNPVSSPDSLASKQTLEDTKSLKNAHSTDAMVGSVAIESAPSEFNSKSKPQQKTQSLVSSDVPTLRLAKTIKTVSENLIQSNTESSLGAANEAKSGQIETPKFENEVNPLALKFPDTVAINGSFEAPAPLKIVYLSTLNQLLFIPDREVLQPIAKAPTPSSLQTKPLKEASGWYFGVQTSFLAQQEKARPLVSRPGRAAFVSKQEKSVLRNIFWAHAGKEISPRISLETGLGYEKAVQTASHFPKFRFGDGIPPGPPFGIRRAYNYDLSTYGGTAEVSLRMEETTGSNPTDDEPVSLKINTEHRMEMLRIPLLAKYRVAGQGRWQAHVKVGLMGNLILKNELDISTRVSNNARFKPVSGNDGYTVQLKQGKFFMGYWLSAGAEFKVNSGLSFYAEPALSGDFPRKDQYQRQLPKHLLLGLNVGANYYF